ncbi:MAG: hypothetical protein KDD67_15290 [Ignavibacteriae bacterium]|nr:hypothetical protein [Ignavibacteriota bacterium]MCB9217706.1 hypothetical protein [Ignavibacteria bacterium]
MTTHATKLFGVLAHPGGENIYHSLLAKRAEEKNVDASFLLFDFQAKDIADPIEALRRLKAGGAYLTGRLREAAGGLVDYLSDEAHGTGTINTITFDGDTATGHNTEAKAVIDLLAGESEKFGKRSAVILGGGVMARAAAYAVVRHFRVKHLTIAARDTQHAQILKQLVSSAKTDTVIEACELFPPDIADQLAEARLIINATSIGQSTDSEESPITLPDLFHSGQVILDVVNKPGKTKLLRDAEEAGAKVIGGDQILERQIDAAFELLTGAIGVE